MGPSPTARPPGGHRWERDGYILRVLPYDKCRAPCRPPPALRPATTPPPPHRRHLPACHPLAARARDACADHVAMGNHESYQNYAHYTERFRHMPANATGTVVTDNGP